MDIQSVKQRFGIIGNYQPLNRAIETAIRVAPTGLSILVTGESGVGKESIPQIVHAYSANKHNKYVALNCGAIPEGTMDSELFGHVKGSFTGAHSERKGYFEEVDNGTIFLDEIAEMPLATQVKLLRVLESGEIIRVGSSKVHKVNVRVIAATNVNLPKAIKEGKFREDLYYRLNTVPITMPSLRERGDDIELLFRKFATDFAEKYRMPVVKLTNEAKVILNRYNWPGNVRQLKNIAEQISILETSRLIEAEVLNRYLPDYIESHLPMISPKETDDQIKEREMLYKVLYDMRKEVNELRALVNTLANGKSLNSEDFDTLDQEHYPSGKSDILLSSKGYIPAKSNANYPDVADNDYAQNAEIEESLSLEEQEKELIQRALEKHRGKRKYAAQDLGISERTLYRKIKEYDLN